MGEGRPLGSRRRNVEGQSMVRVIIGTVAVLAGFIVVERSMVAGNDRGGTCAAAPAASGCAGAAAPGCTPSTPASAPAPSGCGTPLQSRWRRPAFGPWPGRKSPW